MNMKGCKGFERRVRYPYRGAFKAREDFRVDIKGREPRLSAVFAKGRRRVLELRIDSEGLGERDGAAGEADRPLEALEPFEDRGREERGILNDRVALEDPESLKFAGLDGAPSSSTTPRSVAKRSATESSIASASCAKISVSTRIGTPGRSSKSAAVRRGFSA